MQKTYEKQIATIAKIRLGHPGQSQKDSLVVAEASGTIWGAVFYKIRKPLHLLHVLANTSFVRNLVKTFCLVDLKPPERPKSELHWRMLKACKSEKLRQSRHRKNSGFWTSSFISWAKWTKQNSKTKQSGEHFEIVPKEWALNAGVSASASVALELPNLGPSFRLQHLREPEATGALSLRLTLV